MKFSTARSFRKQGITITLMMVAYVFGVLNLFVAVAPEVFLYPLTGFPQKGVDVLRQEGIDQLCVAIQYLSGALGVSQLAVCFLTFLFRRPFILKLHSVVCAIQAGLLIPRLFVLIRVPSILFGIALIDDEARYDLWVQHFSILAIVGLAVAFWALLLSLREVDNVFRRVYITTPALGDELLENLRNHGENPEYRKSWYHSVALHVMVLIVIPWMMSWIGCIEPYALPKGEGAPAVQQIIKIKKPKKKKKKRIVLNMNSAIIFHIPEIDESEVFKEMEQITENQYEANVQGKMGAGNKKGKGGWPTGMERAPVRFIRLQYENGDWDQDMGDGADYNFLIKFREYTSFRIAKQTESHNVASLRLYPKGKAPPFVYITGKGNIQISSREKKILKNYLLTEGGMLFADNGGGRFNSSFRNLMRSVLPGYEFITIAHDDVLFQRPFVFPNGAPPLWHHSGKESLGIKHNGRWIVYYHQGDINDAWKTGHSGADKFAALQAYQLGVNIVYYAFTEYYQAHRDDGDP